MTIWWVSRFAAVASVLAFWTPTRAATSSEVDFSRDIAPILSDTCYACHGPDAAARKADLRLDTEDGAFRLKAGKSVIVRGNVDASELVRRITSADPDVVMPPPKFNRKLTPAQIESLRQWVEQGAKWGRHWAFVPPVKATPPTNHLGGWARNDIDRFILQKLESHNLRPSPEASREALLRRITLDLTGLPPTPAEVDAFLLDNSPDAYERRVDQLLASPRYGERMATDWLDLARYADTHGYQMDRYRPTWRYRDWVISAFNRNLPFDQFITWQLAGDLLPSATKEQRLATAFNRMHMQNEEGGIVEEEFRVAYVVDRVNTFATAFLGLTTECSRCHDHKYDPLKQKEFYALFAFFQNIDESGQTSYFTDSTPVPAMLLSTDEEDARIAENKTKIQDAERQLRDRRATASAAFEQWLKQKGSRPSPTGLIAAYAFDEMATGKTPNAVDAVKAGRLTESPQIVDGRIGKAAALDGENGFNFPGVGHFTRADAFSLSIWIKPTIAASRQVVVHHSKAPIDAGSRGYELLLEDGHVAFGLHHMWPGDSIKVRTQSTVPLNEWTHIVATYDGSSRAAGTTVYVNGEPAAIEIVRDCLTKDITYGGGEPDLAIGNRFRDSGFKGGAVDEFQIYDHALTLLEARGLAEHPQAATAWDAEPASLNEPDRSALFDYFIRRVDEESLKLEAELHELRKRDRDLIEPIPESMVMKELPRPKPAFVLKRGAYDAPGDAVEAGTPAVLPAFPADQARNRLGLARWLLTPEQPLTSRVLVNRAWQQMFGRGLVATSDNFGIQGAQPTHPELLDWLACDFRQSGWDMKKLLRLIATSATYRQSSRADAALLARDPSNELLARSSSRRLTAEMLRDQALADAGLLVEKRGGPSVKPYQPPGLWDVAMGRPTYDQGHGDDLHRRSLYTFWKRTVPPPAMIAFDAAERNVCIVRRQATSTPLQALALLNDVQMVEAARLVSERMLTEGGPDATARLQWAFQLITGRLASVRETRILSQMFNEQRSLFAADPVAARKLLAVGEAKNDAALDPIDLAAGAVVAGALFNHDEAVMRR